MSASRFTAYRFSDWRPYPKLPVEVEDRALCQKAPINWFFPGKGSPAIGKKLCVQCEVRQECLDFAIDNAVHFGLWGGMTERERHSERQRRKLNGLRGVVGAGSEPGVLHSDVLRES